MWIAGDSSFESSTPSSTPTDSIDDDPTLDGRLTMNTTFPPPSTTSKKGDFLDLDADFFGGGGGWLVDLDGDGL